MGVGETNTSQTASQPVRLVKVVPSPQVPETGSQSKPMGVGERGGEVGLGGRQSVEVSHWL